MVVKRIIHLVLICSLILATGCKNSSTQLQNDLNENFGELGADLLDDNLYENDSNISDITYRDAINYQEVLDSIYIPDIERIEKISEYNTDFPMELQDAVAIYIREEICNNQSLEQYKAEYQFLVNDTNKSDDEFDTFPEINKILDVRIGDDELGSCHYIIPIDLNGDGEDEYLLETYYGDAYLGIIVKEEGRYALAGMYGHTKIPMILEYGNQKYVVVDNMIITMDNSKSIKEWDILILQKTVSDYKLAELYSLPGYKDMNMLEEFNVKDLLISPKGQFYSDQNHYFYSTEPIVLPDSVHKGYDEIITVWWQNSDGQAEIVKVYLLVANLEIEMEQKEQVYLLEEHQQYIY